MAAISGSGVLSLSMVGWLGSWDTCSTDRLSLPVGLEVMPIWFMSGARVKRSMVALWDFTPKRPIEPRSVLTRPLMPSWSLSLGSESDNNVASVTSSKRPTPNSDKPLRWASWTGRLPGPRAGMGWRSWVSEKSANTWLMLRPKAGTTALMLLGRSNCWPGVVGSPKRPR